MTVQDRDGDDAPEQEEHDQSPPQSQRGARAATSPRTLTIPKWITWRSVATGAIAVLGTLASVVSVFQFMTRNTTDFDTLVVEASPVESATTEWAVEISKLAEFPASSVACGHEQQQWLEANGAQVLRRLPVHMANTASEGAQLSLASFSALADERAVDGPAAVLVVCDPRAGATLPAQFARLNVDGTPAFFVRAVRQGEPPNADVPVSWNLAPGEAGAIDFVIYSAQAATGVVEVTVSRSGEASVATIATSEFAIPALFDGGGVTFYADADGLRCEQLLQGVIFALHCRGDHSSRRGVDPLTPAARCHV